MRFPLILISLSIHTNCRGIDEFYEGVELSFRSLTDDQEGPGQWIPLLYVTADLPNISQSQLSALSFESNADDTSIILRGYSVPYIVSSEGDSYVKVSICGQSVDDWLFRYPLIFRWLQSSRQEQNSIRSDVILLDNVAVSLRNRTHVVRLLEESFDDPNFTA